MDWFKRMMQGIGQQFKRLELSRAQIMTIAMLGVSVALFMILIVMWGGTRDYLALSTGTLTSEEMGRVTKQLDAKKIEYRIVDGHIEVPADQRAAAVGAVSQVEGLSNEFIAGFFYKDMMSQSDWMLPASDRAQRWALARDNELGRILSAWDNIRAASVNTTPAKETTRIIEPTPAKASVVIKKKNPKIPMDQGTVDAIAAFVSGAIDHLPVQNVTVVDADTNRMYSAKDRQSVDYITTDRLEMQRKEEDKLRAELKEYFAAIFNENVDRLAMSVRVVLDMDRKTGETLVNDENYAKTLKTTSKTTNTGASGGGGDAMTAPMTSGGAIATGGGGKGSKEEKTTTTEEKSGPGFTRTTTVYAPGDRKKVTASVFFPQDLLLKVVGGKDKPADEAAAQAVIDPLLKQYKDMVARITMASPEDVEVISAATLPLEAPAVVVETRGSRISGTLLSYWRVELLALLVLAALGMLWWTLRRGVAVPSYEAEVDQPEEELPSLDELLPKTPVDLANLRTMKMGDVIRESIGSNPSASASLLRRWIVRERD